MAAASSLQARSPVRPVILLSCPAPAAAVGNPRNSSEERLCQVMIQALAEAGGSHVIRRVPRGGEAPRRPGDLGVALHVEPADGTALNGHLEWLGADGTRHSTPQVRFAPGDAEAALRALVGSDPAMTAALKHPGQP